MAVSLGLLMARVPLGRVSWGGGAELHTFLETIATVLALMIGVMALLRYHSQKTTSYLILGSGFLGAALLDGFHTVVTSSLCGQCTSSRAGLIVWTGALARFFLSVLMCASLFIWRSDASSSKAEASKRERRVYLLVGSWTLASFILFLWVPLPPAYQPHWPVHRPAELIAGIFFAIAALGYWRKGDWKTDGFTHSLVLFLIVEALSQTVFIPFSAAPYDSLHVATHVLKIVGYTIVLTGLLQSMYSIFRARAQAVHSLTRANESYASEMEERQRAEVELQESRDELEARVAARTGDLAEQGGLAALMSEIAIVLTQNDSVDTTLQRSAWLMVHFLDAAFVRVWILDRDQNVLELRASAGMYTHRDGAHARVPVGQFKIGRIAQKGQPHLTNDVQQDPWVSDPEWAKREGMVAFGGYPLIVGDNVVGVVAAFARHAFSKAAFQAFGSLAGSISQFIGRKRMEAELQDSEEQVRLLLDSTAESIYGIDLAGNCTFANRACLRMLGCEVARELLGKNMHDVMHHSHADKSPYPETECRILQAFQRGEEAHIEDEVLWRADGSSFPAEYWCYPVRKGSEVVGAVVTFLDISERRRAEEEQRKLVSLVETSDDFIALVSPEKKVLYLNQGGVRMVGLESPAQALGMDISNFHDESAWTKVHDETFPALLQSGRCLEEIQLRHFGTGEPVDVQMNAFLVTKPETGEVLCSAAVMRDITERKRAEASLRTSEERFRIAAENAGDMTFEWDLRTGDVEIFGSSSVNLGDRPAPRSFEAWKTMVHPDDLGAVLAGIGRHIESGERYISEYRVLGQTGHIYYYSLRGQAIRNAAGEACKWIGLVSDITESKQAEAAISQLAAIVQCSEDAIIGTSLSGTITTWNGGAERLLGYTAAEAVGASLSTLLPRPDQAWDILDPSSRGAVSRLDEAVFVCKDGLQVPVSLTVSPIRKVSGEITGVATIARDISARKKAEVALAHQAQHDHLTGLPNPLLLADRLTASIQRSIRSGLTTAVIYVDLDGFKFVNDTLGHEAGDALLKDVTVRLQGCLRDPDTLARMGGDEFMVVINEVREDAIAHSIAERLRTALHRPFQVADHELYVTASIGIALFPRDGDDVSALRRNADAAMYGAKRSGKDRVMFFTPAMRDTFLEHLELETELRHALDRDSELSLAYQPIFATEGGQQTAFEALLRWSHPVLGNISPGKFVPVAEESGLIFRLGAWVLKEACRKCRAWQDHGLAGIRVAANVSALEFARPEFAGNVLRILEETGLRGDLLDLEVTETTLMRDMDASITKMSFLRARGIRISIDDFGTGYSSLGYLPKLPVDTLKIDRSFVIDLGVDSTARSLLEGMISLAHSIGKQVVVEGVETKEQLEILRSIGCDEIQGFLLGRPAALPDWDAPAIEGIAVETAEPVQA
jgi:diguanylate cyclase (GGDEF)-like protein/PAS domain S-box-containing protein